MLTQICPTTSTQPELTLEQFNYLQAAEPLADAQPHPLAGKPAHYVPNLDLWVCVGQNSLIVSKFRQTYEARKKVVDRNEIDTIRHVQVISDQSTMSNHDCILAKAMPGWFLVSKP